MAKFKLYSDDTGNSLFDICYETLSSWRDKKYTYRDGAWTNRRHEDQFASFTELADETTTQRLYMFESDELGSDANIHLVVRLLRSTALFFDVTVSAADATLGFLPPDVSLSSPRFIRSAVEKGFAWLNEPNGDRVFGKPFHVGTEAYPQFEALLLSDLRKLPIVAISTENGEEIVPNLADEIAKRTTGICHCVVLDEQAAWHLTDSLGEKWSCFKKGIRTYWPRSVTVTEPYRHPLTLASDIIKLPEQIRKDRRRVADRVLKPVFEASAFSLRLC